MVAGEQKINPGRVASGTSAAMLLGLPTPERTIELPQFTVARAGASAGALGLRAGSLGRCAWLAAHEIRTTRSGIRITSPIRTVLDCAREMDAPWGLAIADAAIGRWKLDPGDLIAAAEAISPSVNRRQRVLWVVRHARAGVESPLESLGRAVVVLAGLPEPTPQVWVSTRIGRFRVDLLDEANHVITEADGRLKYATEDAVWQEKRREDALRDGGFEVVRFVMADYKNQGPWLEGYRRAVQRSAARTRNFA